MLALWKAKKFKACCLLGKKSETLLVESLQAASIAVAEVNPRRVRDFAKGIGCDAKTDSIDAKVIARYGEVVQPQAARPKTKAEKELAAMVIRRRQLLKMINMENNRLGQSSSKMVKFIKETLKTLEKRSKSWMFLSLRQLKRRKPHRVKWRSWILSKVWGQLPSAHLSLSYRSWVNSIAGKLPSLLAWLRSTTIRVSTRAKRKTIAGRSSVRRVLYMATLVATRFNTRIRAFYQRLLSQGKPKKLALVAAMRKLLTILNTLVKRDELWQEPETA